MSTTKNITKMNGMRHHLQQAPTSSGWDEYGEELDEEHVELEASSPVADGSGAHMHLPGDVDLSQEEQLEVAIQHATMSIKLETSSVGEMIVQLGGETGLVPGPLSSEDLQHVLSKVHEAAAEIEADVTVLLQDSDKLVSGGAAAAAAAAAVADSGDAANGAAAPDGGSVAVRDGDRVFLLLRRRSTVGTPLEIRVAVIGNVDSGKSTMVGVLTRSMLDDGRGAARSKVFKHDHEEATGRTSSIGQHNLCLNSSGTILNDSQFKNSTCADYVSRSSKVVTMVDLAGHERYFKTTAYGLTGHLPDYACLLIGANAGVVGMCKEHLGVALALKVPVFFVITKVDICPDHILKNSLQNLFAILKKPGVKKRPFLIKSVHDVITCANTIMSESLAPILLTSAVTGRGLDLLRLLVNLLPQRQQWAERQKEPAEFIIDETFGVPGVGTVVAGTMKRGVLSVNTPLVLGPDIGDGTFKAASVKSIHYKRLPVMQVVAGQTAALALKKMKREKVRKGMVLVHEAVNPIASWEFDAEIAILTHATTIQPRYQAVIHCEIIRQAARVVAMDKERLRSGDRATVRFRFLQRPEYLTVGARFVFREGRTKGIGMVVGTE